MCYFNFLLRVLEEFRIRICEWSEMRKVESKDGISSICVCVVGVLITKAGPAWAKHDVTISLCWWLCVAREVLRIGILCREHQMWWDMKKTSCFGGYPAEGIRRLGATIISLVSVSSLVLVGINASRRLWKQRSMVGSEFVCTIASQRATTTRSIRTLNLFPQEWEVNKEQKAKRKEEHLVGAREHVFTNLVREQWQREKDDCRGPSFYVQSVSMPKCMPVMSKWKWTQ